MKPFTQTQQTRIVNNVVAACRDISKLNKQGYDFVYQSSGFIAHYDIHGFKATYDGQSLGADLLSNQKFNQWSNFCPGESGYEYKMSRKAIYNAICEKLTGIDDPQKFIRDHFVVVHVGA